MSLILKTVFQKNYPRLLCRSLHSSSVMQADSDTGFNKWYFNLQGFNKYGLLEDDLQVEVKSDVEEAIKRLPEDMQMARLHRAIKAQQADLCHVVLPKEEWTKIEDDHHYLRPYIEEVRKEREEREEWDANH